MPHIHTAVPQPLAVINYCLHIGIGHSDHDSVISPGHFAAEAQMPPDLCGQLSGKYLAPTRQSPDPPRIVADRRAQRTPPTRRDARD